MPAIFDITQINTQLAAMQRQMNTLLIQQQSPVSAASLTSNINMLHNPLYNELLMREGLCMVKDGVGKIYPKGKCRCGAKFEEIKTNIGKVLACKVCLAKGEISVPRRYYIMLRWEKKPVRIFSDNDGGVLSSIDKANDLLIEIRQKIKKNEFNPDHYRAKDYRKLQFDRFVKDWLYNYEKLAQRGQISSSTIYKFKIVLKKYIINAFGSKDLRKFINADIKNFYINLPNNLSTNSQKWIMDKLHQIFSDALADGHIRQEQMPAFPKIKVNKSATTWLAVDAQELIYQAIPNKHKPIFLFIMHTGCRTGEARALHVDDIDFGKKTVKICRTFSKHTLSDKTKTKKDRVLPLDDKLYEMLRELNKISGFVFTNKERHYTITTIGRIWKNALKKAGVEYIKLYDWGRHSFATQAIQRGVPIYALKEWLGHSNIEMTERYVNEVTEALEIVKRPSAKIVELKKKKKMDE